MHQLRHALVVAVLASASTAALADTHAAPAPKTTAPAAKTGKRIPTKTPMPATTQRSLAEVVALGRAAAPAAAVEHAAEDDHAAVAHDDVHNDDHAAVAHDDHAAARDDVKAAEAAPAAHEEAAHAEAAKAAVPAFPTSTSALPAGITTGEPAPSTMPWGAVAFFIALIGGAVAVWWKKKQGIKASGGPLLHVRETTAIGPRRQLLVVDVAGRRVLLSSSEAGVTMLLDCGTTPADAASHDELGATPERFFGDALAKAVRQERQEPTGGLQLVNTAGMPVTTSNALPAPPPMMPVVGSGPVRKNEAEATELMRRLGR